MNEWQGVLELEFYKVSTSAIIEVLSVFIDKEGESTLGI